MRIGIDIGGTKAVVAAVSETGRILRKEKIATGENTPCREMIRLAARKAAEMAGGVAQLDSVGIGIPGTVDATGKIAVCAPNIGWHNEPVSAFFEEEMGISPFLAQDTRAAAWAEFRNPPMRSKRCVVCVTLGTGIGCGIVMNGKIWHGALGTAGEIGHIPVRNTGRICNCGRNDCMEAYASGTGMARTARELGLCQTTEELFALAKNGNPEAMQVIDRAIEDASNVLTAVVNLLSPDAVLFSGGLSTQNTLFVRPLMARIRERAYQSALSDELYLGPALLGPDAPVIGAAFLREAFEGKAERETKGANK